MFDFVFSSIVKNDIFAGFIFLLEDVVVCFAGRNTGSVSTL